MGYQIQILYNEGLTESEQQLCHDYWQCNPKKLRDFHYSIRDLTKKYHLSQGDISNFVKQHCQLILSDFRCVDCGEIARLSLRGQIRSLRLEKWICDTCFKQAYKATTLAIEQSRAEKRLKRHQEQAWLKQQPPKTALKPKPDSYATQTQLTNLNSVQNAQSTSAFDNLLLITFVQHMVDPDTWVSYRLTDVGVGSFSPSCYLDNTLVDYLFTQGLIEQIDDTANTLEIDSYHYQFRPCYSKQELREMTFDLQGLVLQSVLEDKQWAKLFKQLQIAECERYCGHLLSSKGNVFNNRTFLEAFAHIISDWTDTLSVAAITVILWKIIRNANNQSPTDEPIEQYGDRLLQQLFKMADVVYYQPFFKKFNRHYQLPPTPLAKAMVDNVLGQSDVVFHYCLKELLIVHTA